MARYRPRGVDTSTYVPASVAPIRADYLSDQSVYLVQVLMKLSITTSLKSTLFRANCDLVQVVGSKFPDCSLKSILPRGMATSRPQSRIGILINMGSTDSFNYGSLKDLLRGTTAQVLLPDDGEVYEESIKRWSEHCIKRAVCI